jgi:hypothetical protein
VYPVVVEVVLVYESPLGTEREPVQADLVRVLIEAETAGLADTVLAPVDHEAMQVLVGPSKLVRSVAWKSALVGVGAHHQTTPHQGGHPPQHDPQLVDGWGGNITELTKPGRHFRATDEDTVGLVRRCRQLRRPHPGGPPSASPVADHADALSRNGKCAGRPAERTPAIPGLDPGPQRRTRRRLSPLVPPGFTRAFKRHDAASPARVWSASRADAVPARGLSDRPKIGSRSSGPRTPRGTVRSR